MYDLFKTRVITEIAAGTTGRPKYSLVSMGVARGGIVVMGSGLRFPMRSSGPFPRPVVKGQFSVFCTGFIG